MQTFQLGSQHPDIALIQLALKRANHDPGALDGIFGPNTQQARTDFFNEQAIPFQEAITDADWRQLAPFFVGYVRHVMIGGDTIDRIAATYRTAAWRILTANPTLDVLHLPIGQEIIVPLDFKLVSAEVPFSSLLLQYTLQGLQARYPRISAASIGKSVLGADIPVLTFGEGTRAVCFNGSHHANEWLTTPVLLQFLERFAAAFAREEDFAGFRSHDLYHAATLHLIPMLNPDGVDLAIGRTDSGPVHEYASYLAANYPQIPFPHGWKANARGVDLNLQYPAGWETAQEIKFEQGFRVPGPRDYVGKRPLSEPESRVLYQYTLAHDFYLTMSYHSQGKVIYWRYLDYLPENSREIGRIFSEVSGYLLEETPFVSGHAGYKDWFIKHFDRPGYTIEIGLGESPLPLSQFDEIYADNEEMLAIALVI